jgi:hypothetical protein
MLRKFTALNVMKFPTVFKSVILPNIMVVLNGIVSSGPGVRNVAGEF